ncbi:nucleotide exchange factor GrpE [Streptomyces sp. NPDC053750]|uniref:nucleotide exchange factor GrpE n=1 Tax=Streptomyces sp. NPDC053750 TaxID=3365714 RepID=UPI0037D09EA1
MNRNPCTPDKPEPRPPVVVQDRRRCDPVTLRSRRTAQPAGAAPDGSAQAPETAVETAALRRAEAEAARLRKEHAERTADLQRLQAEYANYRKRVRRDRLAVREIAVANVLAGLLPVLDVLEQEREHTGSGPVAEILGERLAALGLQTVGEPGEPFDPALHEAVTYQATDRASRPVCTGVLRRGYRVGEQLLRPAQVSVTGPPDSRA